MRITRHRHAQAAAALVGVALAAAACSSAAAPADDGARSAGSTAEEEGDTPSDALASTGWVVEVDGELEAGNASVFGYLPSDLTVRPGDVVEFSVAPGAAHTVSFGTLVDAALAAGPGGPDGPPVEFEAIPDALTRDAEPVATGLAPCFSDSPPQDGSACEQQDQPVFDGELALYSSGAISGSSFTVEIAPDITPGEYGYLCLLHGQPMTGTLSVVGPDEDVPTTEEVQTDRDQTLQTLSSAMAVPAANLDNGELEDFLRDSFTDGDDATVVAGAFGGPRSYYVELLEFGPSEVTIAAGETVRWHFQTPPHTVSFNAPTDARPYIIDGPDGLPTVNDQAVAAAGGATPIPPFDEFETGEEGPGPPDAVVIDGGTWDGRGFFSSGTSPAFVPVSYDITFTQPGTYPYQCLIHPDMRGTITVT